MRMDSPSIKEGSRVTNLVAPIGSAFPNASEGEIFRLRGHATIPSGLYIYDNAQWALLSKLQPFAEVGSNSIIDVNTNGIVPINLNLSYYVSPADYEIAQGRILIKKTGHYSISYSVSVEGDSKTSNRKTVEFFVRKFPSLVAIPKSFSYGLVFDASSHDVLSVSKEFKEQIIAGESIQLCGSPHKGGTSNGTVFTISDNVVLTIQRVDSY